VRVDEAGDDGIGGEVGDGDVVGCGVGDGLNAVAGDEDVGVLADVAGANVDELAGENGLGGLWSFLGVGDEGGAEDDDCGKEKGS